MAIKDKFYFIIFIDTNLTGYERIISLLWSCQITLSIKNADLMMEKERKKKGRKEEIQSFLVKGRMLSQYEHKCLPVPIIER